MLESSKDLAELNALEAQQREIQRKAKAQAAKLEAAFAEWSGLPAKTITYRNRLAAVEAERTYLTVTLDIDFEASYLKVLSGDQQHAVGTDLLAARIATRDMRLAILKGVEAEANADLAKLDKKNVELSKTLGRPRHKLN